MRIVFTLGGTDAGKFGLGRYVTSVLPELLRVAQQQGSELIALGSEDEVRAYAHVLEGIPTLPAPRWTIHPGPSALWYLAAAGRTAKLNAGDVLLYSAANRRFGAFNPLPTVAVMHDLAQLHVADKYDPLRMAYFKYGLLSVLRRATRLVAVSHATRTDLVHALDIDPTLVDVVPNGVDAARFAPRPPNDLQVRRVRSELQLAGPYVLYPARLEHPAKNHLRLITAFARTQARQTHQLLLVGDDWGALEAIRACISAHDLGDRVQIAGYVNETLIPALFAGADAVTIVGLREGFGLPALEALAAGRPVCASNTGALPEVVGELGAFCDPFDPSSIAAAIDRCVHDEEYRELCAREGPEWAAGHSWRHTAEKLFESCRRAAATRSDEHSGKEAAE